MRLIYIILAVLCSFFVSLARAQPSFITLASTTSAEQTGLLNYLLPLFKQQMGIEVRVIALGTGQALDLARRGEADVVLAHDRVAEDKLIAEGFAIFRRDVMFNDFVLVGPKADPAKVLEANDLGLALRQIAQQHASFVSRGDNSGTHAAERRAWRASGREPDTRDKWYKETGMSMGASLNSAALLNAYCFSDRGTWLSLKNRGELQIVLENSLILQNSYSVMLVNPEKHKLTKRAEGLRFIDWLVSPAGQMAIANFRINGEPAFYPARASRAVR